MRTTAGPRHRSMPTPWGLLLWGATATLLMFGCAILRGGLEPPRISLADIRVQEIKGFEAALQIDLRVFNLSDRALPVEGIDADLALNGRHLATGVADPRKEIPAYGNDIITVTVYSSMLDMIDVAQRLLQGATKNVPDEKWTYAVKGHLRLGASIWPGKLPFSSQGEIDLKDLSGAKP